MTIFLYTARTVQFCKQDPSMEKIEGVCQKGSIWSMGNKDGHSLCSSLLTKT